MYKILREILPKDLVGIVLKYSLPKRDAFKKHILVSEIEEIARGSSWTISYPTQRPLSTFIAPSYWSYHRAMSFELIYFHKCDKNFEFWKHVEQSLKTKFFFYSEMLPFIYKITGIKTNSIEPYDNSILTEDDKQDTRTLFLLDEKHMEIFKQYDGFNGLGFKEMELKRSLRKQKP